MRSSLVVKALWFFLLANTSIVAQGEVVDPDGNEPPVNPYLADSAWPMSHRNPYNQASSPYAAIAAGEAAEISAIPGLVAPITNPLTSTGSIWASDASRVGLFDFDAWSTGTPVDLSEKSSDPVSGAYKIVDRDDVLFLPIENKILAYKAQGVSNKPHLLKEFAVQLRGSDDRIVGVNLTYDGQIVYASAQGRVGVVSRDFAYNARPTVNLFVDLSEGEKVSNSIAVDEDGGIYVVTSLYMHRLQWLAERKALSVSTADGAWKSVYFNCPEQSELVEPAKACEPTGGDDVRIGEGSGTTPTLMGVGTEQDNLVVITDGRRPMRLVAFWRRPVTGGATGPYPVVAPQIAGEIMIDFGGQADSLTEQSVVVRGYGALLVNNKLHTDTDLSGAAALYLAQLDRLAPRGATKAVWLDKENRWSLAAEDGAWTNTAASCPNGVPTMSVGSMLMYCVGVKDNKWVILGLDWGTGAERLAIDLGYLPTYNSIYSALQITGGGDLVTGNTIGLLRVRSK